MLQMPGKASEIGRVMPWLLPEDGIDPYRTRVIVFGVARRLKTYRSGTHGKTQLLVSNNAGCSNRESGR
jgi:hypothetical protein